LHVLLAGTLDTPLKKLVEWPANSIAALTQFVQFP